MAHRLQGEQIKSSQGAFFSSVSLLGICVHIFALCNRRSDGSPYGWIDAFLTFAVLILAVGIIGRFTEKRFFIEVSSCYLCILFFICCTITYFFFMFILINFLHPESLARETQRVFGSILPYLRPSYPSMKEALRVYVLTTVSFLFFTICLKQATNEGFKMIEDIEMRLPHVVRVNNGKCKISPDLLASYQKGMPTSRAVPTDPPPTYQSLPIKK